MGCAVSQEDEIEFEDLREPRPRPIKHKCNCNCARVFIQKRDRHGRLRMYPLFTTTIPRKDKQP